MLEFDDSGLRDYEHLSSSSTHSPMPLTDNAMIQGCLRVSFLPGIYYVFSMATVGFARHYDYL